MRDNPKQVFIDSNIIIQQKRGQKELVFNRIIELVKNDFITILTTDLTKTEVVKRYTENDYQAIKEIRSPHFREIVEKATNVKLPERNETEIRDTLFEKNTDEVEKIFGSLKAKTLLIDSIKPSIVFDTYARKEGFFSGECKKDQFPDAFIFECLKPEASKENPIIIISNDGDFDCSVNNEENEKRFSVLKSFADLFKELNLEIDEPYVDDFLEKQHDEILDLVNSELNNWYIMAFMASDVMEAEIDEADVSDISISDISAFGKVSKEDILVIGKVKIEANVSFSHPDWDTAIRDSEDKTVHPWRTVTGETEVELELDFSMTILLDENGKPSQVEELHFNDTDIYVELYPYETYK